MIEEINYKDFKELPRGMRNNNPGNIKKSKCRWKGKTKSTDRSFEQFNYYWQGVRVMMIILLKYYDEGANTVERIVYKYARENQLLTPYVESVSKGMALRPRQQFTMNRPTLLLLCTEICRYELKGVNPRIGSNLFNYCWLNINYEGKSKI